MTVLGGAARLLVGGTLAWWVWMATAAPDRAAALAAAAALVAAATLWRPGAGLLTVAALTPGAALLATAPVRGAETIAWTFLAAWLLRVWQPLSRDGWPAAIAAPAALYGAALVASWLAVVVSGAAGVPAVALPAFVLRSIPPDHLLRSSPEPETWTMLQAATGIALLLASIAVTRNDRRLVRTLAATLAAAIAVLAVATQFDVVGQWADAGYSSSFLLRYVRGERFSLHLPDLNAAGSLYVLALSIAAGFVAFDPRQRAAWAGALVLMVPALWLTGSRSSYLAAVGGLVVLGVLWRRQSLSRRQALAAAAALGVLLSAGALTMDWETDVRGTAGRAASLRMQFFQTSTRMFASSPAFGVGVGHYFDRSAEFMPAELRSLYGNENAHNYFVQQFAELGVTGGIVFLWLIAALAAGSWMAVRAPDAGPSRAGLLAGMVAYLLTCLTGHPLLVPEAALPFWIAAGALVGMTDRDQPAWRVPAVVGLVVFVAIVGGVVRGATAYAATTRPPRERGFHQPDTTPDGQAFRWSTQHAVTYIPPGVGFLRLRVQPPEDGLDGPLGVETSVGGRVVDRREIRPGGWTTYDVSLPQRAPGPFRRVDLRADQFQWQEVSLGRRRARRPIAVMVGEIRWIPLEEVGGR